MRNNFLIFILSFFCVITFAQKDNNLITEMENETEEKDFQQPAFKAMKICNLQSTKTASKGDLYMYVSHRFGTLKDGFETFFGFDNANTKIQLVYGLTNRVQLGISRESLRKTYAGSLKLKITEQSNKIPVNISVYTTTNLNTELDEDRYPKMKYIDRFSYASQFLISRRVSNAVSFEIAPTFIRQNLVLEPFQKHNQIALGAGGRVKVSKRISINTDYVYNFSRHENSVYKNPLSLGLDIETGGHVFQLLFTNAQSTNEPGFISNAEGNWENGNIFFGFNIVRVF